MRIIISLFAIVAAVLPSIASAEPLVSVWKLQTLTGTGDMSVKFGDIITEQKFVPDRLVVVKLECAGGRLYRRFVACT